MNEALFRTTIPLAAGMISFFLFATLLLRRIGRRMPVFVAYMGYCTAEGLVAAAVLHSMPGIYSALYLALCFFDLVLFLGVLVELGDNLLRSNRLSSQGWIRGPLFLAAGCSAVLWPLVRWPSLPHGLSQLTRMDLRLMQANTMVSVAALLGFLVWTSARKLHWPDGELRVAMGMGLLAVIAFAVLVAYADGQYGAQHDWLDLLTPAACIGVYAYWMHHFWMGPEAVSLAAPTSTASERP